MSYGMLIKLKDNSIESYVDSILVGNGFTKEVVNDKLLYTFKGANGYAKMGNTAFEIAENIDYKEKIETWTWMQDNEFHEDIKMEMLENGI